MLNRRQLCFYTGAYSVCFIIQRGRHGRDRMVVGFTTIYAIIAYNH
jgi:hypothetical protein